MVMDEIIGDVLLNSLHGKSASSEKKNAPNVMMRTSIKECNSSQMIHKEQRWKRVVLFPFGWGGVWYQIFFVRFLKQDASGAPRTVAYTRGCLLVGCGVGSFSTSCVHGKYTS